MQIEQPQNVTIVENKNEDEEIENEHKTLNHNSLYYSFMQRYFANFQNANQYLHMHSNGICLVTVKKQGLPSKPKQITDFIEISEVKGKKKKGGIRVRPETVIAKVICEDGSEVKILALIDGFILQKNQTLTTEKIGKPQGYFVIIQPSRKINPQKAGMKRVIIDHLGQ